MKAQILLSVLAVMTAGSMYNSMAEQPKNLQFTIQSENMKIAHAYAQWKAKNRRLYGTPAEDSYRKEVFGKNFMYIEETNSKEESFKLALNSFADKTLEEIKAAHFGLGDLKDVEAPAPQTHRTLQFGPIFSPPVSKDWHELDTMNKVVHQGSCGSCYAFATIVSLEHMYYLKTGKKARLSEQELVDCSKGHGNAGCRGGWMHQAYDYVIQNEGIQLASSYPYVGTENSFCKYDSQKNVKGLLSSYVKINKNDNDHIVMALQNTVVPSAVDAGELSFYSSGVFDKKTCSATINHAIVIVGYGETKSGVKYWNVRNSWGPDWGVHGHFKLLRHTGKQQGICGITQYNVYPVPHSD